MFKIVISAIIIFSLFSCQQNANEKIQANTPTADNSKNSLDWN